MAESAIKCNQIHFATRTYTTDTTGNAVVIDDVFPNTGTIISAHTKRQGTHGSSGGLVLCTITSSGSFLNYMIHVVDINGAVVANTQFEFRIAYTLNNWS